jgi:hypothetical protein
MAIRSKYLHVVRPSPGSAINTTAITMLPYDVQSTDLPPYMLFNASSHQGVFIIASRDVAAGNVTVISFPSLSQALGVTDDTNVSITELMSMTTTVSSVAISSLAASGLSAFVERGGALVFLVELVS